MMNRMSQLLLAAFAAVLVSAALGRAAETSDELFQAQIAEVRAEALKTPADSPEAAASEHLADLERIRTSGRMLGRKRDDFRKAEGDYHRRLRGMVWRAAGFRLGAGDLDLLTRGMLRHDFRALHYLPDSYWLEEKENGITHRWRLQPDNVARAADETREALVWMDWHREELGRYAASPERGRFGRTAPDVEKAINKLRVQGTPADALAMFHFVMPEGRPAYLVTEAQADTALEVAFGAKTLERLPGSIAGFEKPRLFELMREMIGEDGMRAFSYRARIKHDCWTCAEYPDGPEYYSLPAAEAWAEAHRVELDRILNRRWVPMPVQPAMVWAVQEVSLRHNVPVQDVMVATPGHLYVNPQLYPRLMEVFRANQVALAGERIAGALDRFRDQVVGELKGLRTAVEGSDAAVRGTNAVLAQVAGQASAIRRGVWTLDFLALLALIK